MSLTRFDRREILRAIRSLIAVLDDRLAEVDISCEQHQRLTIRAIHCPECRADHLLDARTDLPTSRPS